MLGGLHVTSEEWLAVFNGLYAGKPVYFCDSCEQEFQSLLTPRRCPKCNAEPGVLAVTLEHKGVVGKTFPFAGPEEREKLRRHSP